MSIEIQQRSSGNVLTVRVSGKLVKQDYERLAPAVEQFVEQHGKLRILLETDDFHGWDAGAFWEDVKFDLKHFNDIERLAIVGERKWEKGMATFCKPFTTAEIRFFEKNQKDRARAWIDPTAVSTTQSA